MTSRTLLVLAASKYQLRTIHTAKRLGYRVITTDNVPGNPGHALADRAYATDTTDLEGVLSIARRERIDGVIAPCTDVAVPTAAYVASRLQLPGPPYESASIVCNKARFRRFLVQHGLPAPQTHDISDSHRPDASLLEDGAWVMKPDRSSGAKGVFIVDSAAAFQARLADTLACSPSRQGVLERFIDGFQGTCEGILRHGRIAHAFFLDRQTVAPPYAATAGHHVPSVLDEAQRAALLDQLQQLWRLLGVTDGPFDCDFVVGSDQVYVLEMTPRLGGNSISALLQVATGGFDLVEYAARRACGEDPPLPETIPLLPTAIAILGTSASGRLAFDAGELAALGREPWVESIALDVVSGAPVEAFTNGRQRVGEAMVRGTDRASLDQHVRELRGRLNVRAVDAVAS
jgi:biotin carboxylase